METYVIVRRNGWRTADDLAAAAERSTAEGERMADDVAWIRSYALAESDGTVGTFCIYQASSLAVLAHKPAVRVDPVASEIGHRLQSRPPVQVRELRPGKAAREESASTQKRAFLGPG